MGQVANAHGAYGLRISGLDDWADDLPAVPHTWPELAVGFQIESTTGPRPPGTVVVEDARGEVWLPGGGLIEISREPLNARFKTSQPVPGNAVLHPLMGLPAAIANRWLARHALHGGAFLHEGRAWAVLGDRESGKSSTLGYLVTSGHTVLSDDILILEGQTVYAGPRTVDLRSEAAHLGGEKLGLVGNRERWRLYSSTSPPSAPLAGFIHLTWGTSVRLTALDPNARLPALIESSVFRPSPADAQRLLDLVALPAWRLIRPRAISEIAAVTARLLETVDRHPAPDDASP